MSLKDLFDICNKNLIPFYKLKIGDNYGYRPLNIKCIKKYEYLNKKNELFLCKVLQ